MWFTVIEKQTRKEYRIEAKARTLEGAKRAAAWLPSGAYVLTNGELPGIPDQDIPLLKRCLSAARMA